MEGLMGLLFLGAFIVGIWLGVRDLREREARDRGKVCPVCKGKGKFRSGQWGGFWDTCIRCGGKGVL